MENLGHFIDGKPVPASGATAPITDPATGKVTREVALGTAADVDKAVAAATRAFPAWAATPAPRRAAVMFRFKALIEQHADELARLITSEHGKVLSDARGSLQRGLEVVEFACGIPHLLKGEFSENVGTGIDAYSLRQPLGVCAGITPFNFPAMVPLWMFPVALSCGNTFILKPSEKVPGCSMRLAELLSEAGAPPGVFNIVNGAKETVDASSPIPASPRSASSARRRWRSMSTAPAPTPENACRLWAAPRTTWWSCPTPISTRQPMP